MDSRLDNIFRTSFRQTESADTWMGIHREEPRDNPRRKKDDGEKKEKPKWEDNTVVSIPALKQFLMALISPDSRYQQQTTPSHTPEASPLSPHQQRAHSAANAYQTNSRHASPPASSITTAPTDSPALTQEENRIIHQLMHDLDLLLQKGITTLPLQKEGSFLESLNRAAKAALESVI